MDKNILYLILAVIGIAYNLWKASQKKQKEAQQKAAQKAVVSDTPTASKAKNFDDMLKRIREAQANEASSKEVKPEIKQEIKPEYLPEAQLEKVGPDIWPSEIKPKPSHLNPEHAPNYKAHSQQLASKPIVPTTPPKVQYKGMVDLPAEKVKAPEKHLKYGLREKGELKKAFIYQVILERKFF